MAPVSEGYRETTKRWAAQPFSPATGQHQMIQVPVGLHRLSLKRLHWKKRRWSFWAKIIVSYATGWGWTRFRATIPSPATPGFSRKYTRKGNCNVNLNTPEDNPLEGTNGWREKGEHRGRRGAVISPVLAILGAEREQKSRSPFPRAEGIWNYKKFSFRNS